MSDATIIPTGPGEMWRPTGELRWVKAKLDAMGYRAVVDTLQQRWASDAGADEWRDVPTVEG